MCRRNAQGQAGAVGDWILIVVCWICQAVLPCLLQEGRSVCVLKMKGPWEEVSTMPKLGGSISLSFV